MNDQCRIRKRNRFSSGKEQRERSRETASKTCENKCKKVILKNYGDLLQLLYLLWEFSRSLKSQKLLPFVQTQTNSLFDDPSFLSP